ncbi:MAG TPA: SusC/RagA family TonB-linked outer membrane protein [Mucilaginibacter sp.]
MKLRNLLTLICFVLSSFLVLPAMAQNKTVTGKVTDAKDGSPLPGVTITLKGTTTGTNTDANGAFSLSVPPASTLVITFLGYTTQEVSGDNSPLNIKLQPTATALNEVVVVGVGYGTQRKKDVTGAVESISSKDFNQGAIVNPLDQIQGKVAGLTITKQGGDPNDQSAHIAIRGQTSISGDQSPLFVIDGVATSGGSQFQNLSPSDIESYDVLKDASATAIYGSRGANGVIIVTTKKGRAGRAQIDYNAYVGFSEQAKYFDLLNASEYSKAIEAIPGVTPSTYELGGNTDWQKAVTRKALQHSNNVAISGGAEGFNYRASINYEDQQGIVLNTGKKQLGLRFNGEQKALDNKLDITLNVSNTTVYRDQLTDQNVFNYFIFNAPPTYPVYNPDGTYYNFTDYNLANPVAHLNEITNKATSYQTLANATANYTLLPSLKVGVTGIMIHDNTLTHYFYPSFPLEGNINNASQNSYNVNTYEANAHINFDKSWGKHTVSATGVYEYNQFDNESFSAAGADYLVPPLEDNVLGSGDPIRNSINSSKDQYKIISFLARINYNYNNRFYVTASVRRDGSDKFGADHQWGTFPSFDIAYRFKNDLLKNVDWINDIKLRVGYGVVGNSSALNVYQNIALFGPDIKYFDGSTGTYPSSYTYKQNANPDLQWEERRGKNIGIDFSLFNSRLTGDINYYNDKTDHMLYQYAVPTPPYFVGNIFANVGSLTNKGLEVSLTGQVLRGDALNWSVNGQITFNKTRIVSLSGTYQGYPVVADQITTQSASGRGLSSYPITFIKPGQPLDVFYIPHFTGVDANGNELFDGKTIEQNANPQRYYIDPNPKFNYGINNSFTYKNWSLNFFLRGVYGGKAFNNALLDFETATRLPSANTTREALTNGIKDGLHVSDHWLESTSFLRLDNASLGYNFKNVKGFSNLRVYIAGNNLFVITKYRGLDPEINPSNHYTDTNTYPVIRSFVFGTNVSFK